MTHGSRPTTLGAGGLAVLALLCWALGMGTVVFDPPEVYSDILRSITLVEATMVVVISSLVARRYWHNFQIAPAHARLLPRHVMQLGMTLTGLAVVAACVAISKVGDDPAWWTLPLILPSLTIGVLGMYDMVRWLPDRRNELKPTGETIS